MLHKEMVLQIFEDLKNLWLAKNANYGNSIYQTPILASDVTPEKAIRVRMSDKINRLQTLLSGEPDKVGESMEDTVRDLVVYGINWLALTKKDNL